jgi:hypothetical protein
VLTQYLLIAFDCGHICPGVCGELCPTQCPQCRDGQAPGKAILVGPDCGHLLSIEELDQQIIGKIYNIDESGCIRGFGSADLEGLQTHVVDTKCPCGASLCDVRRYSILKLLNQSVSTVNRLIAKIGKKLNSFSRRIYTQEWELSDNFSPFSANIRPNPLAARHNKGLVTSRAQLLLRLCDEIREYSINTVTPFEQSVSWLTATFPNILSTCNPIFSLRFALIHRRATNIWIADSLRVSRHLAGLADPSLEVQRMAEVLRLRASTECEKNISECEEAIIHAGHAPSIEVETRLQLAQSRLLLYTASASAFGPPSPSPSREHERERNNTPAFPTSSEADDSNLQQALQLCRRFPDTAGRFTGLVNAFLKCNRAGCSLQGASPPTMASSLSPTYTTATRRAEFAYGEWVLGCLRFCKGAGHPYCEALFDGCCPECGREVPVRDQGKEGEKEFRAFSASLREGDFLAAMGRATGC